MYYLAIGDHPVDLGRRGILLPVEQVQILPREVRVVRLFQVLKNHYVVTCG